MCVELSVDLGLTVDLSRGSSGKGDRRARVDARKKGEEGRGGEFSYTWQVVALVGEAGGSNEFVALGVSHSTRGCQRRRGGCLRPI